MASAAKRRCHMKLCAWSGIEQAGESGKTTAIDKADVGTIELALKDETSNGKTLLQLLQEKEFVKRRNALWILKLSEGEKEIQFDDDGKYIADELASIGAATTYALDKFAAYESNKEKKEFEPIKEAWDSFYRSATYTATFRAWFLPCSIVEKTDEALRGKLVSELAARSILDNAVLNSHDIQDAVLRVVRYAEQFRAKDNSEEEGDDDTTALVTILQKLTSGTTASPFDDFSPAAQALIRSGTLGKSFTPMGTILRTRAEADAAGDRNPAGEIDARTAPFEADDGHADLDSDVLAATVTKFVVGTWGALVGTSEKAREIVLNSSSGSGSFFGQDAAGDKSTRRVAMGAIVYSGRVENFLEPVVPDKALRTASVAEVENILRQGTYPLATKDTGIDGVNKVLEQESIEAILADVRGDNYIRLFRVDRARETELEYRPVTVDYGTAAESPHFGIGSNVSMMVDCAFAAARTIFDMEDAKKLEYENTKNQESRNYFINPYVLKQNGGDEIAALAAAVGTTMESLAGFATIRSADRGRFIAGSVFHRELRRKILAEAVGRGFRSLKLTVDQNQKEQIESEIASIDADIDSVQQERNGLLKLFNLTEDDLAAKNPITLVETAKQALLWSTKKLTILESEKQTQKLKQQRGFSVDPADVDNRLAKLYHAIWSRELGAHAVAQGTARLEESHMMTPFLARAVASDSEHVVPTLMAVDDWIGPTEEYARIEEMALMAVEDYARARPATHYAAGGRAQSFNDVGVYIKQNGASEEITLAKILGKVDKAFADRAVHVISMLLFAIQENIGYTADIKRGGLTRIRASETTVRQLAERVAQLKLAAPTD